MMNQLKHLNFQTQRSKSNTSLPLSPPNLDVSILTVDTVTLNSANLEANLSIAAGIVVAGTQESLKPF